ncbi:MAG: hypothetical protein WCP85_03805 [Mariniphaga sp.]
MNTKKSFCLVVVLFIVVSAFAGNNKNSYSGVWKLNKEKTPPTNSRLFLSQISFSLKGDSLFTVRTYENDNGETYPFDEKLTMDGKEYKIEVYNFPRKAKAHWSEKDGFLVIESVTTFTGDSGQQDLIMNETWKVDEKGTSLDVEFTTKLPTGDVKGTFNFNKSK